MFIEIFKFSLFILRGFNFIKTIYKLFDNPSYNMFIIHYTSNKNIGYVWRGIKSNLRAKNSTAPVTISFLRKFIIYTFNAWYVNKYSRDLNILVRENKYNLKSLYIIKNMFSSRIIENSTRNQVTGYRFTFQLRVQVNFPGMDWPGYGSVRVRVD